MPKKNISYLIKSFLNLVFTHPRVFIPFLVMGLIQIVILLLVFLSPQTPMSVFIGPPIRTFFGEAYLHYPNDLILLPKIFQNLQIPLDMLLGPLIAGCTVVLIASCVQCKDVTQSWMRSIREVWPKYLQLFILTIATYYAVSYLMVGVKSGLQFIQTHYPNKMYHLPKIMPMAILAISNFVLASLFEVCFIYAFPAMLLEQRPFFRALKRSFEVVSRNLFTTIVIVVLPLGAHFIFTSIRNFIPIVIQRTGFPEISVWILMISVLSSFLLNSIITISTTLLFIMAGREEQGGSI